MDGGGDNSSSRPFQKASPLLEHTVLLADNGLDRRSAQAYDQLGLYRSQFRASSQGMQAAISLVEGFL